MIMQAEAIRGAVNGSIKQTARGTESFPIGILNNIFIFYMLYKQFQMQWSLWG